MYCIHASGWSRWIALIAMQVKTKTRPSFLAFLFKLSAQMVQQNPCPRDGKASRFLPVFILAMLLVFGWVLFPLHLDRLHPKSQVMAESPNTNNDVCTTKCSSHCILSHWMFKGGMCILAKSVFQSRIPGCFFEIIDVTVLESWVVPHQPTFINERGKAQDLTLPCILDFHQLRWSPFSWVHLGLFTKLSCCACLMRKFVASSTSLGNSNLDPNLLPPLVTLMMQKT